MSLQSEPNEDGKQTINTGTMFEKFREEENARNAEGNRPKGLCLTDEMLARGRWWNSYERDYNLIDRYEALRITDWKNEKGYTESKARICARSLTPKTRCKWTSLERCPGCTNLGTLWDHQSMWRDNDGQLLLVLQPYLPSEGYMTGITPFEEARSEYEDKPEILRAFCELNGLSYKIDTEWSWHYPGWTTLIELRSLIPIPPKRQYGPQVDLLV